jgi:hypothetical protein
MLNRPDAFGYGAARRTSGRIGVALCLSLLLLGGFPATGLARPPLDEGQKAPLFTLQNGEGKEIALDGFLGKSRVVLVFLRGFF